LSYLQPRVDLHECIRREIFRHQELHSARTLVLQGATEVNGIGGELFADRGGQRGARGDLNHLGMVGVVSMVSMVSQSQSPGMVGMVSMVSMVSQSQSPGEKSGMVSMGAGEERETEWCTYFSFKLHHFTFWF
jgi:hypothetical protein